MVLRGLVPFRILILVCYFMCCWDAGLARRRLCDFIFGSFEGESQVFFVFLLVDYFVVVADAFWPWDISSTEWRAWESLPCCP